MPWDRARVPLSFAGCAREFCSDLNGTVQQGCLELVLFWSSGGGIAGILATLGSGFCESSVRTRYNCCVLRLTDCVGRFLSSTLGLLVWLTLTNQASHCLFCHRFLAPDRSTRQLPEHLFHCSVAEFLPVSPCVISGHRKEPTHEAGVSILLVLVDHESLD